MPALVLASAGKPSEARYLAEPMSNGLGMTKQPGAACSSAKRARFSAIVGIIHSPSASRPRARPFAVRRNRNCLAQDSLEGEAEALGGATRRRVQRVALPLVAAIAELIEQIAREQILRLGRAGRPLHRRGVHGVA